jgi:hypothetical protein
MLRRQPLRFDPIAEAVRNWRKAGWGASATGMAMVTSIMRAQQILLARVDATLAPFGLTFARFEVLMLLDFSRSGQLPLSRIVDRVPHPTDARTTLASITKPGRRLVRRAAGALNAEVFDVVGLPDEDARAVICALSVLRRNAGDFAIEATQSDDTDPMPIEERSDPPRRKDPPTRRSSPTRD